MARVFLIGATSAIAAEMARLYAARGDSLFLLARNEERLRSLALELGACVRGSLSADLDETGRAEAHVRAAVETLGGLDTVVIAHGLLGDQRRSESEFAEAEAIFRTNLLASTALLIPLGNHFAGAHRDGSDGGRIALLSSVAGDRGRPHNYTYGSAKAALNVYLQGLRSRLYPTGTSVSVLKLGPVDTPMTAGHPKNGAFVQPGPAARRLVAAIDRRARVAYVPGFWRLVMFSVRSMPEALFQRLRFLSGP
jgi:short-subunit dehydrogenase